MSGNCTCAGIMIAFLFSFVPVIFIEAQTVQPSVNMNDIASLVLNAIRKNKELKLYDKSFATDQLNGAFFHPLWKLSRIYSIYDSLGFPSPEDKNLVSINKLTQIGKFIHLYDANEVKKLSINESFLLFHLLDEILNLHAKNVETVVVTISDCQNYKKLTNTRSRITYNEAVRPRYYLALFIDIYRVLMKGYETCQTTTGGGRCFKFFDDYQHLLFMYSWVICRYIGSSSSLDVDGICPKICRPYKEKISSARLVYADDFTENALDICEQLQYAVPGSCSLTGTGVEMYDFKCECLSQAYEWKTTDTLRGCLLKDSIMDTMQTSNETNWRVPCSSNETEHYCNPENTELCYYRLWKESKEPVLNLTTFVRQSRTPFCHCKPNFGGTDCSDPFDPCVHNTPLAINDPKNYMNIHIPEGPFMPLYSIDELSGANGNWLCGVQSERGTCMRSTDDYLSFKCKCAKGFDRDYSYSYLDNCMKEAILDRATEIDGHPAVHCGKHICTHGGKCVYKILNENMEYNISDASAELGPNDHFDYAEVCQCPDGYVGSNCDVEENTWSEWEAWSPCVPHCGQMRFMYRVRMCVGDTGCVGSALESAACTKTECPLLSVFNTSGKSTQFSHVGGNYYQVTQAKLLSWMLGLVVPLEIFLIAFGLLILEKCIIRHR